MIGTSQLINTFSRPYFTDTTDIFKDGSGASGKFGDVAYPTLIITTCS
jgi:hypothetical protein